jgi:hypothetical protein
VGRTYNVMLMFDNAAVEGLSVHSAQVIKGKVGCGCCQQVWTKELESMTKSFWTLVPASTKAATWWTPLRMASCLL